MYENEEWKKNLKSFYLNNSNFKNNYYSSKIFIHAASGLYHILKGGIILNFNLKLFVVKGKNNLFLTLSIYFLIIKGKNNSKCRLLLVEKKKLQNWSG